MLHSNCSGVSRRDCLQLGLGTLLGGGLVTALRARGYAAEAVAPAEIHDVIQPLIQRINQGFDPNYRPHQNPGQNLQQLWQQASGVIGNGGATTPTANGSAPTSGAGFPWPADNAPRSGMQTPAWPAATSSQRR